MSKKLSVGLLGLSFIAIFTVLFPAQAAFDLKRAILFPGNPLYFIKEFTRNVQRTLTVDNVLRAELELSIADSLASEIVTVEEKDPSGLDAAVKSYSADLDLLKGKLSAIKESGREQSIGRLVGLIIERSIAHDRLLSGISIRHSSLEADIESARNKISDIVIFSADDLYGWEKLTASLGSKISEISDPAESVSALDLLIRIEDGLKCADDDCPDRDEESRFIYGMKDASVARIEGMLRSSGAVLAEASGYIDGVPGSLSKIKIVTEIAERASDISVVNRLRSVMSELIESSFDISSSSAAAEISPARNISILLSRSAAAFSSYDIMPRIDSLIDSANMSYDEGRYSEAFASARSASVIASKYLTDISVNNDAVRADIDALRDEYAELVLKAENKGLTSSSAPALWSKISEAEKMLDNGPSVDLVRSLRTMMSEIGSLIEKPSVSENVPKGDLSQKPLPETGKGEAVFCPMIYSSVCGKNGVTYSNSCVAGSAGMEVDHDGPCKGTGEDLVL